MLFNIIKEKARAQHKYHLLAMEQKRFNMKPNTAQPQRTDSTPPKTGCWHCQGSHWLRDCPTATAEDKSRAVDRMKEVKDRSRVKMVRTAPQPGEVMVNELIVLAYCADSGSDSTVIPRTAVEELVALGSGVKVQPLPTPVDAIVAGGSTVVCRDSVTLNIVLQTATGTVRLQEVTCLVMEGNESDFLLGNDTLVSLGIDVNHQLEQLAGSALPEDVDPFEEEECPDADLSVADIREKLEDMVVAAGNSGFDQGYMSFLRDIIGVRRHL
ncbi:uncharacterized protein PITG_08034 [Phytophthora infestans T30-4]|uniref:Uncharacterized protein n=1 Tax=Phytophthora infestans (strain T30-4) TaxID=403677 RepID=D0N9B4_PHYIT|nr:uncharacterized protein PITG_08034 [Phytophthora infestans T30-4]EEY54402.1 conserved hypothetical protein [Phytophthora infestans T30-4]|eukprot:XP_002904224.1 conserved hypothetical protein [Phytophthora infestans T30-4]